MSTLKADTIQSTSGGRATLTKQECCIAWWQYDQHGTAIITTAALINALDVSKKKINNVKIVVNGAGASAQACTNLFKSSGVKNENIIMSDSKGVIYKG